MSNKEEVWKDIVGYEGYYKISNLGRIVNAKGVERKIYTKGIYHIVQLCKDGARETCKLHRLLVKTFIDNPFDKPCVNHINGNKKDNSLDNLEWCTHRENSVHAIETGLSPARGDGRITAKLTSDQVSAIRSAYVNEAVTQRELAKEFNVSFQHVSDVISHNRRAYDGIIETPTEKIRAGNGPLTNEDVAFIKLWLSVGTPITLLRDDFHTCRRTIRKIRDGKFDHVNMDILYEVIA